MAYAMSSCRFAGPTCIHASPRILAVTSPCRYFESTRKDHIARVASARASSSGCTSRAADTDRAYGTSVDGPWPARRLMNGLGGGTGFVVYGARAPPERMKGLGVIDPSKILNEARRRLNLWEIHMVSIMRV